MINSPNIEDALNATYKFWKIDDNGNIIRLVQEDYIIEKDRFIEMNWLNSSKQLIRLLRIMHFTKI